MSRSSNRFNFLRNFLITLWALKFAGASVEAEQYGKKSFQPEICETEACKNIAAEILEKMNRTMDPCNNFYEFVCGNFSRNAIIPDDQSSINVFSVLRKKVQTELKVSIENEIKENDPQTFKSLKSYYDVCMNEDQVQNNSITEFFGILKRFGNWPVLTGDSWKESSFDWKKTIQKFRENGFSYSYFIGIDIESDLKNNSRRMLYLDQASLGISQEYLSEGLKNDVVQAYFKFMIDVAEIFGAERNKAEQELKESLNFEIALAKISLSSNERRDTTKLWNPMTIEELQLNYPFVSWREYLNRIMSPYGLLRPSEIVSVAVPNYLGNLSKLIEKTPKRVLANYAIWRITKQSAGTLNQSIRKVQREFSASMSGNNNQKPRWQECLDHVNSRLHLATGALYVRRRFDKKSKDDAWKMIDNLRKTFRQMLIDVDWMEGKTKKQALDKLDEILPLVAYPDELLNDKILDNYHKDLKINTKSFLKTMLNYNLFATKKNIENLRKPVVKDDWTGYYGAASVVNAFYNPLANTIQFPAGILQGSFFNAEYPKYTNYAGIGSIVGHEMTHGFDDQGRKFDKNGNLIDWWDPNTTQEYNKKAECIVKQYSNYKCGEVNLNVNGEHTQGENIADNGGLKEAYYAYQEYQKKNGEEPRLPGFETFTPKQMFWISNANCWCSKYRPQYLTNIIKTDPHTPSDYRVIGPVSNMPEFAIDFNCPIASTMNPTEKCSVW